MRILVTGITGAIGSRLAPQLLEAGNEVHALSRGRASDGGMPRLPDGVRLHTGDAISGIGLPEALEGVEVTFYLIHSMEPGTEEHFGVRERRGAENFAEAAADAGVRRIVYLGGLVPQDSPSPHLASRLAVERILLEAVPDSVALRAPIVIGARSRSFRFLVRLVERMPVLVIPAWGEHRTAPIDERDVLRCLVEAASESLMSGRSLDLAGPDVVTYQELIERIRDHLLISRPALRLPGPTLTPIASRVSAVIAGEQHALIGPLMVGLETDLLPRRELALEMLGIRPHRLDAAIERALRDWEATETLRGR
ncbi:MAG: NAD(P)H-binding protein [Solirubrobacteraceae bacterium]